MTRSLQKIGDRHGIILTRVMLEHLGVTDEVEIRLEQGRIVITAPSDQALNRQSFQEAQDDTFEQYDVALQRLADVNE